MAGDSGFNVQDPNAQRAQPQAAQALTVSGQYQDKTLAQLGAEDIGSATRTATAMGALIQDVAGVAQQMIQKEQYIEAYANAGAGRSVQEIRNERPAWESLFGPSATVQGAQARSLQTATADFGNEGLSMVELHKDKDPGSFHALLGETLGKHLTGDSITDTLITQKATELVPAIAAAQYKAHSKYVQDLNVTAANASINTTADTLKTMLGLNKDIQSKADIEAARSSLKEVILNSHGMDATAHQAMVVQNAITRARQGDISVLEIVQGHFVLTDKQDTKMYDAQGKYVQGKTDEAVYALKDGQVPSPLDYGKFKPNAKQRFELSEAQKDYNKIQEHKYDLDAAISISSLEATIKNGSYQTGTDEKGNNVIAPNTLDNLIPRLLQLHDRYPTTMTESKMESLLGMFFEQQAKGDKEAQAVAAYTSPNRILKPEDQEEARRAFKVATYKKYAGDPAKAEAVIQADLAGGRYGVDKDLSNKWTDILKRPFDAGGKESPSFNASFVEFKSLYKLNPDLALEHLTDPVLKARMGNAMMLIDLGQADEKGIKAKWAFDTDLDAREITRNPAELKKLEAKVQDLTKGGLTRFVPFMKTGGLVRNIGAVRHAILQDAGAVYQYNGISAEAAFDAAGRNYAANHETVLGESVKNGGRPLAETMGLKEHAYKADDAFQHFIKRQNIPDAAVRIINGVAILTPCDKNGIATGKPSLEFPLKTIGKVFNDEVITPKRLAHDKALGRSSDSALERSLDSIINSDRQRGIATTREQALAKLNGYRKEEAQAAKGLAEHTQGLLSNIFTTGRTNTADTLSHAAGIPKGVWNLIKKYTAQPKVGRTTYLDN